MSAGTREWWADPSWTTKELEAVEDIACQAESELDNALKSLECTVGPVDYWLEDYHRYLNYLRDTWVCDRTTEKKEAEHDKAQTELARVLVSVANFYDEALQSWTATQTDYICSQLRSAADQITWARNHQ